MTFFKNNFPSAKVMVMYDNSFISKDELHAIVCKNIKKHRKRLSITQFELSEKINMSHEYLRQLESNKGQKDFTFYTLYKIAMALHVSLDDFIVDNDKMD